MTIHVNIGEAKTRFSELCAAALRGENVVVQRAGVPTLRLVPIGRPQEMTPAEISAMRIANMGKWGKPGAALPSRDEIRAARGDADARMKQKFGDLLS
jgi:antitoxin (DNA-binding transcriptional repressor) of toxin-antitoxin stability system